MNAITPKSSTTKSGAPGMSGAVQVGFKAANLDAELLSLEKEWRAANEAWRVKDAEADAEGDKIQDKLPAWARPGTDNRGRETAELELDYAKLGLEDVAKWGKVDGPGWLSTRPSLEEIERHKELVMRFAEILPGTNKYKVEELREKYDALLKAREDRYLERKALKEKLGWSRIEDLVNEADALWEQASHLERTILETPAHSPAGVAVKLRVYAHFTGLEDYQDHTEDNWNWDRRFAMSALADVEQMAAS